MSAPADTRAPDTPAADRLRGVDPGGAIALLDAGGFAPGAARDLAALMIAATLDGVTATAPLPPGPKLFLANHQIALDLVYLAAWLNGPRQDPTRMVAWDGLSSAHPGEMLTRLARLAAAEGGLPDWLSPRLLDTRDPAAVLGLLGGLGGADAASESLLLATEGMRQTADAQPVARVGSVFVDAALARGMPIVPVRFAWAVPDRPSGRRLAWPHRLAPMHIFLGGPIAPSDLAKMPLGARRDRIAAEINVLYRPPPPGHRQRNADIAVRIGRLQAGLGLSQTKAMALDLLLTAAPHTLSPAGRAVRAALPDPDAHLWRRRGPLTDFAFYLSDAQATTFPGVRALYRVDGGGA